MTLAFWSTIRCSLIALDRGNLALPPNTELLENASPHIVDIHTNCVQDRFCSFIQEIVVIFVVIAAQKTGNLMGGWLGGFWSNMHHANFFFLMAALATAAGVVAALLIRPLKSIVERRAVG
jgi:hypothetical protein